MVTGLDLTGDPLARGSSRALTGLRAEIGYYHLTALRDAAHHVDAKGSVWKALPAGFTIVCERKDEIEKKLREAKQLVVASHSSFEQVLDGLRRV